MRRCALLKVLLTGGFGYLGGRLAETLAVNGEHEVTLATRRLIPQPSTAPGTKAIRLDWDSDADLRRACEGTEIVVHLAGMNAADCARDPVAALAFNGVRTAQLVVAATDMRVRRFIYLSTAHVYGGALKGSIDERTCPDPLHPYATSHRAGEDAVRLACKSGTLEGIVIRLSNSFGAPVDPRADCWSLVTNDLCRQAVQSGRSVLRSDGNQRRDFMPISEACRAIEHLMTVPKATVGDGLFNVGGGWAPRLSELAELVAERVAAIVGTRPKLEYRSVGDAAGPSDLRYGVTKLQSTGFISRPDASVAELDRLVRFCTQHFSGSQA